VSRRMRTLVIGTCTALVLVAAGCGDNKNVLRPCKPNTNEPGCRPPAPVNITAAISQRNGVEISPRKLGAGPATLIVTNQTGASQTLIVKPLDADQGCPPPKDVAPAGDSGAINPQGTATVQVDLSEGDFCISAGDGVRAAVLHVGHERPSAQNDVLQP